VISEGIHSGVDLLAALIALFSVRVSSRPADHQHAYGHGKVENLSALVEGALIILAAVWIVVEAVRKLMTGEGADMLVPGIVVMGLSALGNWFVSAHLFRVAKAEESMALEADALHLRTDVWTSAGVFGGLLLVQFTHLHWLDPVVAMCVACMILKAGWELCMDALHPLVDARLPEDEEQEIVRLIEQYQSQYVNFHDLRTRRSGAVRHVDFHLVVRGDLPLADVHGLCDQIEAAIRDRYPTAHVLIHAEPVA
jgi:cation diffusion facilitator family transporter